MGNEQGVNELNIAKGVRKNGVLNNLLGAFLLFVDVV